MKFEKKQKKKRRKEEKKKKRKEEEKKRRREEDGSLISSHVVLGKTTAGCCSIGLASDDRVDARPDPATCLPKSSPCMAFDANNDTLTAHPTSHRDANVSAPKGQHERRWVGQKLASCATGSAIAGPLTQPWVTVRDRARSFDSRARWAIPTGEILHQLITVVCGG